MGSLKLRQQGYPSLPFGSVTLFRLFSTAPHKLTTSPPLIIADAAALESLLDQWIDEPVVGIDTEAASFHRYRDRVYLVQLSTPTATAIVDPLGTGGIEAFRRWFDADTTEFVFHDADYDLRLMHREAGLRVHRLFDTRIAAQFLNLPGIGLGAILEQRFSVATDKRFQRADWSARPLSPEMVAYAATDTRFLPALRETFRNELEHVGRLEWVLEECVLQTGVEWAPADPPELGFFRVKGARDLDRRGLAILRELFVWRERTAERLDRASFRVIGNETLLLLTEKRPRTPTELPAVRGVGPDNAARWGAEIVAAIDRGLSVPDGELPVFERSPRFRPDPAFETRLDRLKQWRTGFSARTGLPPGLLAPNATLEGIARQVPATSDALLTVPGVRRWQVAEFGDELLAEVGRAA